MTDDTARTLARIGAKQREWTEKRDAAIIEARKAGMSLRAIGDAVGLSHMAVDAIVKRGS